MAKMHVSLNSSARKEPKLTISSPMKLRMDLRDHWENAGSPAQTSLTALKELIGLPVNVILEPAILWSELQKYYPDQGTFIPTITDIVKSWCDILASRLQDEAYAEWTEELLEVVNEGGRNLTVRVGAKPENNVSTSLEKKTSIFIIGIPQMSSPSRDAAGRIAMDFHRLFTKTSATVIPSHEDDDWASVTLPSREQQARNPAGSAAPMSTKLPTLDSLPRPEILFPSQTPYHMMVEIIHNGISIHGSHQPSLELIASYLTKYARTMQNSSKQPIIKPELQVSHLGYGALYDSLKVVPGDVRANWDEINPILILNFVEGVLGYRPVGDEGGGAAGSKWYFKREVAFRD